MYRSPLQDPFDGYRAVVGARLAELSRRRERGDVPGWVLVTLMTALLVGLLYAVAGPRLLALLNQALSGIG